MKKLYKEITHEIIELMQAQQETGASWFQPWATHMALDQNMVSGHVYSGINMLLTARSKMKHGFASNSWLTFNQAKQLGGQITKGEKATRLVTFCYIHLDKDGKMLSEKQVEEGAEVATKRPWWKWLNLFNAEQVTWPEGFTHPNLKSAQKLQDLEGLVQNTKSYLEQQKIAVTSKGQQAYYNPSKDEIVIPAADSFFGFDATKKMNLVLAHEAIHSTGHKSRLDRDLSGKFGSKEYAREELIAELGSVFLCAKSNLQWDMSQNADYLNSWIILLKEDDKAIFKAASAAQKAVDFVLRKSSQEENQPESDASNS